MVVSAVPAVAPLSRWPRLWEERELLLERQHDRLEADLLELISLHGGKTPPWEAAQALACEAASRRLVWQLQVHLRLEERWLSQGGCLCSGHREAHREARRVAFEGCLRSSGDRAARLQWLLALQAWFSSHRSGPDRLAYALAATQP